MAASVDRDAFQDAFQDVFDACSDDVQNGIILILSLNLCSYIYHHRVKCEDHYKRRDDLEYIARYVRDFDSYKEHFSGTIRFLRKWPDNYRVVIEMFSVPSGSLQTWPDNDRDAIKMLTRQQAELTRHLRIAQDTLFDYVYEIKAPHIPQDKRQWSRQDIDHLLAAHKAYRATHKPETKAPPGPKPLPPEQVKLYNDIHVAWMTAKDQGIKRPSFVNKPPQAIKDLVTSEILTRYQVNSVPLFVSRAIDYTQPNKVKDREQKRRG